MQECAKLLWEDLGYLSFPVDDNDRKRVLTRSCDLPSPLSRTRYKKNTYHCEMLKNDVSLPNLPIIDAKMLKMLTEVTGNDAYTSFLYLLDIITKEMKYRGSYLWWMFTNIGNCVGLDNGGVDHGDKSWHNDPLRLTMSVLFGVQFLVCWKQKNPKASLQDAPRLFCEKPRTANSPINEIVLMLTATCSSSTIAQ